MLKISVSMLKRCMVELPVDGDRRGQWEKMGVTWKRPILGCVGQGRLPKDWSNHEFRSKKPRTFCILNAENHIKAHVMDRDVVFIQTPEERDAVASEYKKLTAECRRLMGDSPEVYRYALLKLELEQFSKDHPEF